MSIFWVSLFWLKGKEKESFIYLRVLLIWLLNWLNFIKGLFMILFVVLGVCLCNLLSLLRVIMVIKKRFLYMGRNIFLLFINWLRWILLFVELLLIWEMFWLIYLLEISILIWRLILLWLIFFLIKRCGELKMN